MKDMIIAVVMQFLINCNASPKKNQALIEIANEPLHHLSFGFVVGDVCKQFCSKHGLDGGVAAKSDLIYNTVSSKGGLSCFH